MPLLITGVFDPVLRGDHFIYLAGDCFHGVKSLCVSVLKFCITHADLPLCFTR